MNFNIVNIEDIKIEDEKIDLNKQLSAIKKDKISKIYAGLKTGDIILFSSDEGCSSSWIGCLSQLIKCWTCSEYTHVGIILVNPIWLDSKLQGVYVWESGIQVFPDADNNNKNTFGVRLSKIEDCIEHYIGNIKYRSISKELDIKQLSILKCLYDENEGKPYDTKILHWFRVAFDLHIGDVYNTREFFCSAWVLYILCQLNIVDKNTRPWKLCQPKHLSSKYLNECINGFSFAKEKIIR